MFTGLVEEIGEIININTGANSAKITIKGKVILENVKLGDSIAVNGVCLTVVNFTSNSFTVDVMPETMRKSSLRNISKKSLVNLERALKLDSRLGGHIVSGHIDCIGEITSIVKEDIATWITIKPPEEFLKYIVQKGSVALDGVSLTVAEVGKDYFKVSIIPHTKGVTILSYKKVGDIINIECDVLAKYVEKLLFKKPEENKKSGVTMDMLIKNGFM
ncbi:riboflavin synthase [Clostridium acetireducens DSM 10703]|uniref:Riboflavin synthase n=1 Tax=Clostridium acetireducens DSM 10703 TaxID=1121290 RepID=A0A1E8EZ65_9CLOT|nr:riboflavin synthase [Clostridium acetireducens]OFI06294.1 riboflavin synthase [Clostridium acetireducens DSM 10703]